MPIEVGQLLADWGELTLATLRQATDWRKANGGSIERALLAVGAVTEEHLTEALSKVSGVPAIDRSSLLVADASVVGMLPAETRRRLRALPFQRHGNTLHVATSDPKNPILETGLVASTGCEVRLFALAGPVLEDVMLIFERREARGFTPAPQRSPTPPPSAPRNRVVLPEPEGERLGDETAAEQHDPPALEAFEKLARALLLDAMKTEASGILLGVDRIGGFARSFHSGHPPLTRRMPEEVVPLLVEWLEKAMAKGLVVERRGDDGSSRRYRAERSETVHGLLRVLLTELDATSIGQEPEPPKPPEPDPVPQKFRDRTPSASMPRPPRPVTVETHTVRAAACGHVVDATDVFCPVCGDVL